MNTWPVISAKTKFSTANDHTEDILRLLRLYLCDFAVYYIKIILITSETYVY